jgi:ADP-ribose pyrophosphatase YjhB (NUDIX family)
MNFPQNTVTLNHKKVTFVWMRGASFYDFNPITQCYGIIINPQREVLLGRQKGAVDWVLPGGKPENKETPLETLKRELIEEVDVEIVKAEELGLQKAFDVGNEDNAVYQARFIITEYELKDPTPDPDGGVLWERKFFPYTEVNKLLKWGITGDRLIEDAIDKYNV